MSDDNDGYEKQSLRDLYEQSRHGSEGDGTGRNADVHAFRMMAVVVSLIVSWVVYANIPVTHAGATVTYDNVHMAEAAFATGMTPDNADDAALSLSMDFSRILTPAAMETSEIMRHVANECLPEEIPTLVMPGGSAMRAFDKATDYLVCSMRTQVQRFCNRAERDRLIEQLLQYRDRRQNVLAVAVTRDAMMRSRLAQQQMMGMKVAAEASGQSIDALPEPSSDTISRRVLHGLTYLVENGLIARSDFGFFGFYLPEEYLPALMTERHVASCGF